MNVLWVPPPCRQGSQVHGQTTTDHRLLLSKQISPQCDRVSPSGWIEGKKTTNACGAFEVFFVVVVVKANPSAFHSQYISLTKNGCGATLFAALKSHLRPASTLESNLNPPNPPSAPAGSYPRAQNVTWSSVNFKTILTWGPQPSSDYTYTVEYSS